MQNATNRLWDDLANITNPNGVQSDTGTKSGDGDKGTVRTEVPLVAKPKQVQLNDVKIYVVSKGKLRGIC